VLYDFDEKMLRDKIEFYPNSTDLIIPDDGSDSGQANLSYVTIPLVVFSGLIDGWNPCAFSLLIFFLSFLFSLKRNRKNVFGMGLVYILGVFIGYISIGLGIIRTVSLLGLIHPFGLLGIALMTVMGVLQIRDALVLNTPILKFPGFAVPTFKKLTEKSTIPIALILGVFVSLNEFPCSGGVYVGILVLLSSLAQFYNGLFYLVIYNVMFVVPLFILLLFASNTDILLNMDEWRVVSRRRLKLLSGVFLIIVAILTWFILYPIIIS
jgi:cytochrome c biogenesis protein CcdA